MASWYSSSEESDDRVVSDPDERFEARLAEVEKEKTNYGICISPELKRVWHILHEVLDALGFLYGERLRDEVRGGLRWLLSDRESLSQIGLIVSLRERHLWVHDGHFNVLEWGGVDLYAYLEKYGIECSGSSLIGPNCSPMLARCGSCMKNSSLCTAAHRERDFRFLYDTIFPTYGNSLETVSDNFEGPTRPVPFLGSECAAHPGSTSS
jgi:hypothetical protein